MENLWGIIGLIGGWSVIATAIAAFIGNKIGERISIKWKEKQEAKLEMLRSTIAREQSIFSTIMSSYNTGHHFAQSKRISSIEKLWKNVLTLRESASIPIYFYGILLEEEYDTIFENEVISAQLKSIKEKDTIQSTLKALNEVEIERPFITEYIWQLFSAYRIIIGRVLVILEMGYRTRNIICWYNDKAMESFLPNIFEKQELQSIVTMKVGSFQNALNILESKMLVECDKIISGQYAAESNVKLAEKIQKAIIESNRMAANDKL